MSIYVFTFPVFIYILLISYTIMYFCNFFFIALIYLQFSFSLDI